MKKIYIIVELLLIIVICVCCSNNASMSKNDNVVSEPVWKDSLYDDIQLGRSFAGVKKFTEQTINGIELFDTKYMEDVYIAEKYHGKNQIKLNNQQHNVDFEFYIPNVSQKGFLNKVSFITDIYKGEDSIADAVRLISNQVLALSNKFGGSGRMEFYDNDDIYINIDLNKGYIFKDGEGNIDNESYLVNHIHDALINNIYYTRDRFNLDSPITSISFPCYDDNEKFLTMEIIPVSKKNNEGPNLFVKIVWELKDKFSHELINRGNKRGEDFFNDFVKEVDGYGTDPKLTFQYIGDNILNLDAKILLYKNTNNTTERDLLIATRREIIDGINNQFKKLIDIRLAVANSEWYKQNMNEIYYGVNNLDNLSYKDYFDKNFILIRDAYKDFCNRIHISTIYG